MFCFSFFSQFFFKKIFYIFLDTKRGRSEGEKHQCVVVSHTPPTGDLAHNPGMCPVWVSNQWPFALQADAQSTELHQPEISPCFLTLRYILPGKVCHCLKILKTMFFYSLRLCHQYNFQFGLFHFAFNFYIFDVFISIWLSK